MAYKGGICPIRLHQTWPANISLLSLFIVFLVRISATTQPTTKVVRTFVWDERGYLIYCPCMGRFGNQAEQFLGALGFAKTLNRTLVLPPWRTYKNVPFDEWFRIEPLTTYHRVILAEDFMAYLAPTYWPPGNRTGWCFSSKEDKNKDCQMKQGIPKTDLAGTNWGEVSVEAGFLRQDALHSTNRSAQRNPFGPFWDGLGVDFDANMPYTISYQLPELWKERYPASKYPVVAMRGAPASFPVSKQHVSLHKYLYWSEAIEAKANDYIEDTFDGREFIGIHLRNGVDWVNACGHVDKYKMTSYMASPQCLGYHGDTTVTHNICLPSTEDIIRLTKSIVSESGLSDIYVATDRDPMLQVLETALRQYHVQVFHLDPWLPQLDLAILGKSKHFIGNCVSSFTSFVARTRARDSKPTSYWGMA